MEIPKEISDLPNGLLSSFLYHINNDLDKFIEQAEFKTIYNDGDAYFCMCSNDEDTIEFQQAGLFLSYGNIYKIKIDVLKEFMKKIFLCSEKDCENTRRFDSKYCKEHYDYYCSIYGLVLSSKREINHLNSLINHISDDKKNK